MSRLTHIHAMKARKTALSKRITGVVMILFPAPMSRTTGIKVIMNRIGRSHKKPNNAMGKPSLKFRLFTNSRIMNGSTRRKLMIAGDLKLVRIFFIESISLITKICSG